MEVLCQKRIMTYYFKTALCFENAVLIITFVAWKIKKYASNVILKSPYQITTSTKKWAMDT